MQCLNNLLLNTDSYKASHWLQYPPRTDATFFYVESRGGLYDRTLFYGLQAILKEYLAKPITHADVDEARDVFAAHGEPFNEAGWRHIIDRHGGHLPIRIRAVPEGTVVPTHQALVTIESTDPHAYWLPSYLETMLLRLWYPVTVAVVSDSYDVFHAIREHWGRTLKDDVIRSGATLVVRPDSGDPVNVVHQCLTLLDEAFGHRVNGKGYKVLNHVRVIQGDGIDPNSMRAILERATSAGYATDNLAFGMGGALLQQLNRDTQKFALKCSAARIDGRWIDVYKDPVTDKGKQSKRGRMTLLRHRELGTFQTVPVPPQAESVAAVVKPPGYDDAMGTG